MTSLIKFRSANSRAAKIDRPLSSLRRRVHVLMLMIPIGLILFVLIYEVGLSEWFRAQFGANFHFVAEVVIYGLVGPLLAYLVLHFLDRWLEERETSDLQAHLLDEAQLRAKLGAELSDDALQTLFAASVLISSLKSGSTDLSPETKFDLARTEESLNRAIQQIRSHLLAK
jgi:signal transduction histidine kinase